MLGAPQLAWLQEQLRESNATFKVLVSGSGWTKAKGAGGDSWAAFIHERDQLFDYIRDNNITGVLAFDFDGTEPTLTFNNYLPDGTSPWEPLVLRARDLVNGAKTYDANDLYDESVLRRP